MLYIYLNVGSLTCKKASKVFVADSKDTYFSLPHYMFDAKEVCACMRTCVHACVRACVCELCVCVRACGVCVCVYA